MMPSCGRTNAPIGRERSSVPVQVDSIQNEIDSISFQTCSTSSLGMGPPEPVAVRVTCKLVFCSFSGLTPDKGLLRSILALRVERQEWRRISSFGRNKRRAYKLREQ